MNTNYHLDENDPENREEHPRTAYKRRVKAIEDNIDEINDAKDRDNPEDLS